MFNLMDNISTIELTGAPEQVTLPVAYTWVWARNDGSETVYMSRSSTVSSGANGSISIPAGGAARLFVNGYTFYVNGSGTVLINATDTDSCPFRDAPTTSGGGTGGDYYTKIQSDTRYAQKSEIPTTLPANGGNADSADTLTDWGTRTVTDANDAPFGFCAGIAGQTQNMPNSFWSTILTTGSSTATNYKSQIAFPWAYGYDKNSLLYRCENSGEWSNWREISTTPIKSTTFSGTTDAYSNMSFWAKSENKIPILFECENKNAAVFYGKSGYFYAYVTDNLHQNVVETAVSGTVWYVEV